MEVKWKQKESFSWAGTHILQAELKLLFVREEILRELNCQVVVGEEAVEKSQHLQRRGRRWNQLLFCISNWGKDRQESFRNVTCKYLGVF